MRLTHIKTMKELVDYAVRELVRRAKIQKQLELEGRAQWTGGLAETRQDHP